MISATKEAGSTISQWAAPGIGFGVVTALMDEPMVQETEKTLKEAGFITPGPNGFALSDSEREACRLLPAQVAEG